MKISENVTYSYDHYYNYQEITDILHDYAEKYPQFCQLSTIGESVEHRQQWLLKVTNTATGDYDDKPAYFVEGNIHAGEVTGSMAVMHLLDTIFTNLDSQEVQDILADRTIYAVPRLSPDGSEWYLTTPDTPRSVPRATFYTDDLKGLNSKDMDGDGCIRVMRVKSPFGNWKVDETDPRVMVRRRPDDTTGTFYNVYSEGDIDEYDGMNIKPGHSKMRDYDLNRNYPVSWKPDFAQHGAGENPLCAPETQNNAKFLLEHPNVCFGMDFHTAGGQILVPPGHISPSEYNPKDFEIYNTIAKRAAEENGYDVVQIYSEYTKVGGSPIIGLFIDYCDYVLGFPCYAIECWNLEGQSGITKVYPPKPLSIKEQEENTKKIMKWVDENCEPNTFKPWTAFNHPQLGEVEIGGIENKYVVQNPPRHLLKAEVEKQTSAQLVIIKTLPVVKFEEVKISKLDCGLYRVEATIGNHGYLPTCAFNAATKLKQVKDLCVTIDGCEVVEGKKDTKLGQLAGFVSRKSYTWGLNPMTVETEPLEKKATWLVKANTKDTITLTVTGSRTGKIETTYTLD